MLGMNRDTGVALDGVSHLTQSLGDLLTTPVGSRVMRRDYGLPMDVIDMPINRRSLIDVYAAAAAAIGKWEPRFALRRVYLDAAGDDGAATLTLTGDLTNTVGGDALARISVPLRAPAANAAALSDGAMFEALASAELVSEQGMIAETFRGDGVTQRFVLQQAARPTPRVYFSGLRLRDDEIVWDGGRIIDLPAIPSELDDVVVDYIPVEGA